MSNPVAPLSLLVRPNILALQPYTSARDEFTGAAAIFLDANENSLGSPLATDYSRYPDPQQQVLKNKLAALKGLSTRQIFVGNGSDEAIDLLLRGFVEPGRDNMLILPPTYGMYAVQANIHGAEIRRVPLLPDFSPDVPAIRAATDERSKLLFLCSPNNPTGQCLPAAFVLEML
ncbi:MAG: aminotransferase class I/II-fold pyridoxal phosphate-dependent enzyme, partial [Saprospiraceae bacterium]